jgi:RNA recognition motif-containing protein
MMLSRHISNLHRLSQVRLFSHKIFVSNLPHYWDANEINSRFSTVGQVNQVKLIKNNLGKNSGKAIVEFNSKKQATAAVEHFHDRAVDNLVCNARPFIDKNE